MTARRAPTPNFNYSLMEYNQFLLKLAEGKISDGHTEDINTEYVKCSHCGTPRRTKLRFEKCGSCGSGLTKYITE